MSRPRRDPRADAASYRVPSAPRLRLDRSRRQGPGAFAEEAISVEASAPRVTVLDDPDFWVLVFADPGDGRLSPIDRQVLGAARLLAGKSGGVVLAAERDPADAGGAGADRLIAMPGAAHPQDRAAIALAIMDSLSPRHVLTAETGDGGDLARRIAVARRMPLFPGVEQLTTQGAVRTLPGLGLDETAAPATVMTIVPEMILPHGADIREARPLSVGDLPGAELAVETVRPEGGSLPLGEAGFVVSAGNGVHDFDLFREVAALLGATAGASRVVCDAGLMPRSAQVGASGTVLSADCYLALGIAGAPQHLQGIAGCEHVVAVNTDLHAAMIDRAGLAIIADAQEVMAALKRLIERERGA